MDDPDLFLLKNYMESSDDSSDDDTEIFATIATLIHSYTEDTTGMNYVGSIPGHAPPLNRNRVGGHETLWDDYFHPTNPTYPATLFRRRFRMSRPLFLRILHGVTEYDDYFECKPDAAGKLGFSSYQKCTAAIRMLAYGVAGDLVDEYLRMSAATCLEAMLRFCKAVVRVFGKEYLREPTLEDTRRLLSINEARGFPGMLGSIDCMHWEWKNCPFSWQGQYKGHFHKCTVILEAVASQDLWIWHSFFGMAGTHNDINVLQRSPVFDSLTEGNTPVVSYFVNGHEYTKGYYLADGIYPPWSTFVKTVRQPLTEMERRFAQQQEACRKDVERAFGVLQSRWAIVRHPARTWDNKTLWEVMTACVIMHNMIVEDERDDGILDQGWEFQGELVAPLPGPASYEAFRNTSHEIRDSATHYALQNDLMQHQ